MGTKFQQKINIYLGLQMKNKNDTSIVDLMLNDASSQSDEQYKQPGNIDLTNRPKVKNSDGSISTVASKSFNFDGNEVLLPTISDDGRKLSDLETIQQYQQTGKHLGIFSSPEEATKYAQKLHEDQAQGLNYLFDQPGYQEAISSPPRTKEEEDRRTLGRAAKVGVAFPLGIAGSTQQFGENLIAKAFGEDPEKARSQLKKWGLEPQGGRFPTTEELKQGIEEKFPSTKPESKKERGQEEDMEFFMSLLGPGAGRSLFNRMVRSGVGTYTARKLIDEMENQGASPNKKAAARILIAAVSQSGRLSEGLNPEDMTREQRVVYAAGQRAGLTDEELTPLLQGEQATRRLGAHTAETEANRAAIAGAERGTSQFINSVHERGRGVIVPQNQANSLRNYAERMRDRLMREPGDEPHNQAVVNYLNSIIRDIGDGPVDAEQLMLAYRGINRVFRENRPSQMNLLQPLNTRISRTITNVDRDLGRDFRFGNRLYERRLDFINNVGWRNLERSWAHGTTAQGFIATILAGAGGAIIGHPAAGAVIGAGVSFARDFLSNQLLMNPRWQGVLRTSARAMMQDSPKLALTALKTIKDKMKKENPEAYKNIDWPE